MDLHASAWPDTGVDVPSEGGSHHEAHTHGRYEATPPSPGAHDHSVPSPRAEVRPPSVCGLIVCCWAGRLRWCASCTAG
ncbi:hypothetical protein [Spirillospora sp. CA-294931]|uniref:hypothetical protein n=1 Tax=Spirillospora sp. CA-294931 TaxID=3240042 RepID=UPI003D8B1D01